MQAQLERVMHAVRHGHLPQLQALLKQDRALASTTSSDGWAPLHIAARNGQIAAAGILLEHGASLRLRANDPNESHALHVAAAAGQTKMMAFLLEQGADPNSRQKDGWTALHLAAQAGNVAGVRVLLEGEAKVGAKTESGLSALDLALSGDHHEVASLLRDAGGTV